MTFRQAALDRRLCVNDSFRHGVDLVLIGQVRKFRGFNAVSHDQIAFNGELIGKAHGPGTVRSSGCDKDLQMNRLAERSKFFLAFWCEPGLTL